MLTTKKKKKIQAIEELFWRVVNTYCTFNFDTGMRIIYRVNLDVTTYLVGITYNKWARAHFGMFRYNIMTTNIIELFNTLARTVRSLSITILIEFIYS